MQTDKLFRLHQGWPHTDQCHLQQVSCLQNLPWPTLSQQCEAQCAVHNRLKFLPGNFTRHTICSALWILLLHLAKVRACVQL